MFLLLLVMATSTFAQESDAEGCADSKLLTRLPGCVIAECDRKDFDSVEVFSGAEEKKQNLEGATESITYDCGENTSMLQMVRNAENALKKAGYSVVFSGTAEDSPAVTAKKGGQWIQVRGFNPGGGTFGYHQLAVRVEEMTQAMEANADVWAAEIAKTGSCSIYGVLFDSGKASIKPESKECLDEVVKLLAANPTWKMRIEGHTDNVGSAEANQALSEKRAAAVVDWLAANGVARMRLESAGRGASKPVADNATEEGRSRNRRVVLVKL